MLAAITALVIRTTSYLKSDIAALKNVSSVHIADYREHLSGVWLMLPATGRNFHLCVFDSRGYCRWGVRHKRLSVLGFLEEDNEVDAFKILTWGINPENG